jgi:hypothetical protein
MEKGKKKRRAREKHNTVWRFITIFMKACH